VKISKPGNYKAAKHTKRRRFYLPESVLGFREYALTTDDTDSTEKWRANQITPKHTKIALPVY
jgi:hypothetical protein